MKTPWPWLMRPGNCRCERCIELREQEEVERVVRVLNYWKEQRK